VQLVVFRHSKRKRLQLGNKNKLKKTKKTNAAEIFVLLKFCFSEVLNLTIDDERSLL
jgi:hypothetical protein